MNRLNAETGALWRQGMRVKFISGDGGTFQLGKIVAVCVGGQRGKMKKPVAEAKLLVDHGLEGDCHSGPGARQVSLIAIESVVRLAKAGDNASLAGFSENLTTEGVDLLALKISDRLRVGDAVLEVTQVGRDCSGDCVATRPASESRPAAGLFARVVVAGVVRPGDEVKRCDSGSCK